jgi:NAD(P)-dependent dehydrogenase (short-subunit alcohol dehydrogenase family)
MVASAQRVKDSSRAESLRSVLRACHGAVWTVDLLVNNAAISAAAMVEDTPAGVAVAMSGTNVVGPLRVILAFVPGMRERGGGRVVKVSSAAGQGTRPPTEGVTRTRRVYRALWNEVP